MRATATGRFTLVWVVAGVLITVLANGHGAWYISWLIGFCQGLLLNRHAIRYAMLTGAISWGAHLVMTHAVMQAASVITDVMGFGPSGAALILITVLWGTLLVASGAWVGRSAKHILSSDQ